MSVDLNLNAFNLGRHSLTMKNKLIETVNYHSKILSYDSGELIKHYYDFLIKYQNKKYADKYLSLITLVQKSEKNNNINKNLLSKVVAKNYFRIMSYKDEYEVSRLFSENEFYDNIKDQFEGDYKIKFNLSPPIFYKKDPVTKNPIKSEFGSWIIYFFKVLSKLKFLRHTPFDPFGYLEERKLERSLILKYKELIIYLCNKISVSNYDTAVEIASNYDQVRGFGYIKKKNLEIANSCEDKLMSIFNG